MAERHKRTKEDAARFVRYLKDTDLFNDIKAVCLAHHVTPEDIYLDDRGATIVAARMETWWWLLKHAGKSTAEIGRMFDRNSTSVTHAMRKLYQLAEELRVDLADPGRAHGVAQAFGWKANRSLTESGRRVAQTGLGTKASLEKRNGMDRTDTSPQEVAVSGERDAEPAG